MRTIATATGLGLVGILGACAGPLNTENQIGTRAAAWSPATISDPISRASDPDTVATDSYRDAPVYTASGVYPAQAAHQSVTGLDRSTWDESVVAVPNDLTAHQPRYTNNLDYPDRSRRAQGLYPTAQSAFDTGTTEGNDHQCAEAFLAPFGCAADVILFIPRAVFVARPGRPTRTGTTPYERLPTPAGTIQQQPITPVGPAVVPFPTPATPDSPPPAPAVPEAEK